MIPAQTDYRAPGGAFQPLDVAHLKTFFTAPARRDLVNFNGYLASASNGRYSADVTVAPLVRYLGCPAMLASSAACSIGRGLPHVGIAFPIKLVNSGSNLAGGTGGPLELDGVKIPAVAIGGAVFRGGQQRVDTIVLHEFGHLLGLADLYFEHPSSNDPYPAYGGESAGHFGLIFSGLAESAATRSGSNRYTSSNWYDGTASGISISDVVVNADHSVTATFTANVVASPCTDVACGPNEQCLPSGERAGSCAPLVEAVLDGGLPTNPHNPPPSGSGSGCSTPAGATSTAMLWLLPLPLLLGAAFLRRKARA